MIYMYQSLSIYRAIHVTNLGEILYRPVPWTEEYSEINFQQRRTVSVQLLPACNIICKRKKFARKTAGFWSRRSQSPERHIQCLPRSSLLRIWSIVRAIGSAGSRVPAFLKKFDRIRLAAGVQRWPGRRLDAVRTATVTGPFVLNDIGWLRSVPTPD